jgi:4-hydroxy-2-oxoheptanedioate aldolase
MRDGTIPPGALASRLRRGDALLGLVVKMPCAATIEMAGYTGFDFALIDTEHGPGDMGELEHHLRAADSVALPAIVRVGSANPPEILRALDAGAQGIVVPHVMTAEDAGTAVAAARYPPKGRRGLALSTRAGRYGRRDIVDHIAEAEQRTLVLAQIEDGEALAGAGEIARAPGVDAVFIGPTDLSASLGAPGDLGHPAVAHAIDEITSAVLASDQAVLCVVANDDADARRWVARGARIVMFVAPSLFARCLDEVASQFHTQTSAAGRVIAG